MEKNGHNEEKHLIDRHVRKRDKTPVIGNSRTIAGAHGNGNKPILVPLDGSSLAEMALPHAVALARATSSGLLLMRVVPPFIPPITRIMPMGPMYYESTDVEIMYDEQQALARDYLQGVVLRLASIKTQAKSFVTDGIPEDVIVQYAQEHPEVLGIAMSTHGRSGVGRWLFGSVAEKVLHNSPVPVLLVRPGMHMEAIEGKEIPDSKAVPLYKTLLVPLDGSLFAEQALDQALPLARTLDARVVLLSVVSTPFDLKLVKRGATADWSAMPRSTRAVQMVEYLDGVTRKLATAGVTAQAQVTHGDRVDEILSAARSVDADLIVMSTHGHGGRGHLTVGSVAMSVAQMAAVPLLLVHTEEPGKEESELRQESESIGRRL